MLYNLLQSMDQWLDSVGLYSFLQVLYQREFRAFTAVIVAFFIVLLFGKWWIRLLVKWKIGDHAMFDHAELDALMKNKENTPTMGGVLLIGSILITTFLLADLFNQYVQLLIMSVFLFTVLGGFDDWLKLVAKHRKPGSRDGLYRWEKLLFQFGIGLVVALMAWQYAQVDQVAHSLTLPFVRTYLPGTESLTISPHLIILGAGSFIGISIFMVMFMSNAVNITDGLDGLAPGTVAIASFAMMVLSYIAGSPELAGYLLMPHVEGAAEMMVVAGASAGACLGFLWFNCYPAKVFMGDTGSLPLGGLLATIAIIIRQEFLLLIIGGIFVVEIGSSFLQIYYYKFTGGKRLFKCAPIHHHFHRKGWSESQVVIRFWVVAVILAMFALVTIKMR
ncbi:MAG: phospho-N-acetylmuramoyl-pentapeptide-transferase [Phycisphaerae bacterium]|jgi:phospho-N-acetylmuramoyl-pentapeptide-transferase|nr:phospho-N-acetylmuramoyl-pentapeptide-transferase [Phycisphaerae bacterium]MBT5408936.1 phospho-N-acetylmuramoyl-pentapeptide-transferase [Phycisphaerae bacterium]MBT6165709.1 phospho-N-acetylmuramoyl-pentapeptide-transferase [Phycisphaerae bacterium]MBT7658493.1 phospho-N-acetylmuramoyl-pentapeptide-transferase [Phycisphaerae bacterium]